MLRNFRLLLSILLFSVFSCKESVKTNKNIEQGVIHYKIEYLNLGSDALILEVLPDRMSVFFNQNNSVRVIEDSFGIFRLTQINNSDEDSLFTMLKIWDKKYVCKSGIQNTENISLYMPQLQIQNTSEEKKIIGYDCEKVIARCISKNTSFDVYYTDKIKIKNANASTPYRSIDGVLLEYSIYINQFLLRLTAEKIESTTFPDEKIKVPDEYKTVTMEELQKVVSTLEDLNAKKGIFH